MSHEAFGVNDLVICDKGAGKLVGGGFNLKEGMLGHSAMTTTDDGSKQQKGGSSIISSLKGLAVPAGLLFLQKSMQDKYYEFENKDTVIDDNLYDKLYKMASEDDNSSTDSKSSKNSKKKKRKPTTRKKKTSSKKKGTRRRKK